ncbi:globin domain-containing protein [Actinomadura macrotermitis]|uniref:nitric oxide dioxygenase n=1 Tax=Actinomadura macrotermitis TaxID=2585200 RepID=A0A7K0C4H0_9ACTN|nr:globin domain-containing protein [Actinomadura macrotermitis]MQY08341.1 Flavohemoprotein [Actinomadura macrotermitis]
MDAQRLKENFARVAEQGDAVALFFYSDLFVGNPQLRDMFPIGMAGQRDKLLRALGLIVSRVDDLPELVPFLQQLGRDHRKFGILAEHYPHVGASLIRTLRYFSGSAWTPELEADWGAAYGLVAQVMQEAADDDSRTSPPWWEARVVAVERRRFDLAVLRVEPDRPLPYLPGQSVAVEVPARLRQWRFYSMANAPRPDNTLDFHVRLVDGGAVSSVMVRTLQPGDRMRLGAPIGTLVLDESSPRDVLLVAGSTGLAPIKAILEQIAQRAARPPAVQLFFGARTRDALYDLEDLRKLAAELPWLTVVPAVSDEAPPRPGFIDVRPSLDGSLARVASANPPPEDSDIEYGALPAVLARRGSWAGHDAYVCGPAAMVANTVDELVRLGVDRARIRQETFVDTQR